MLKAYAAVMLGGALGSGMRMALSSWVAARFGERFPLGTLLVNVSGCFIIGLVATLVGPDGASEAKLLTRQFVMIGILGGYTTFSSFALQTLGLAQNGDWFRAALNSVLSLVLCLLAVWLGHLLATAFHAR